jgi:nucleotide-binding universal stress UspA family protein
MMETTTDPCIVVGIDGSAAAVDAALWAIDQAVHRDIPLRLVYVIDSDDHAAIDPDDQARRLATADVAVRAALTAVESTHRPVKIEVDIRQGRTVQTLLVAARSAAMLCVGARGHNHSGHDRVGSTAAALSAAAPCPVAIVRTRRLHCGSDRAVAIEITDSAEGRGVLRRGLEEARRRHAPVRVLTPARRHTDVTAQWERRLSEWRHHYPDLSISTVSHPGDTLDYLGAHGESVQLVVAGRGRPGGVSALVGTPGNTALRDTDCSILVCEPPNAL